VRLVSSVSDQLGDREPSAAVTDPARVPPKDRESVTTNTSFGTLMTVADDDPRSRFPKLCDKETPKLQLRSCLKENVAAPF
jgi:hypothetical protein